METSRRVATSASMQQSDFRLFDSHAHLDDDRFEEDRAQVIQDLRDHGILCTCVGSTMDTSRAAFSLAQANDGIWAAVGVHPHDAKHFKEETDIPTLRAWCAMPKVVALGEIGLDYFYDLSPRETQRTVFLQQLALAAELSKPTILHIRDAHGEIIDLLQARKGHLPPFLVHCYSGSWESAKVYMDLGAMVSMAGPVTFRKSVHLQEVARNVPLDRLLIETDSPYLSPEPVRGKRNDPRNVAHVAACIAELRGMSVEAVAEATLDNACRFYGIQSD